jgi:curved DNA-binding protein CbpA
MTDYEVLGLMPGASEEEVRAAWVKKVKEFPPDRNPGEFEQIRNAYDALRNPRRMARAKLFSDAYAAPLPERLDKLKKQRQFAGPALWRAVLKTK